MPAWLLNVLIALAIRFGIPYVLTWIAKVPWLGKLLPPNIGEILEELLKSIGKAKKEVRDARNLAITRLTTFT